VWSATWRIIQTRPWLGVGPGNFAMTYPRFMPAQAWEKAREAARLPPGGVVQLRAVRPRRPGRGPGHLLLARGEVVEHRGAAPVRRPNIAAEKGAAPDKPGPTTIGWEYYLGGMFGVLLGFVLRASQLPAGALIDEALTAGVRSMAWFAAFGLLERVAWTDRERVAALAAGVAACLFCPARGRWDWLPLGSGAVVGGSGAGPGHRGAGAAGVDEPAANAVVRSSAGAGGHGPGFWVVHLSCPSSPVRRQRSRRWPTARRSSATGPSRPRSAN